MRAAISPSLMCMDFLKIREQMETLNPWVDYYHADIMDGHFCKNITMSPDLIGAIHKVAEKPIDVHLMTTDPGDWIDLCAKAGASCISPHAETINTDAFRIIQLIRSCNCKVGVVLNPATPVSYIQHYLGRIDILTLMTVDVGFAGQPFIPEVLDKIREAKALREKNGYHYLIQIDGSCNHNTFAELREAGADMFIVGSSGLFGIHEDLETAGRMLRDELEQIG